MPIPVPGRSATLAALLAGLALTSLPTLAATGFSSIAAFGDSLTDNGNALYLSGGVTPQAGDYWQGRFSNGPVAVEYLANHLGLGNRLYDFAIGGSGTGAGPTDLTAQLGAFNARVGVTDPNALYFVWSGSNNVRDLLAAHDFSSASAGVVIGQLASFVGTLYGQGARNFLLPLLPDLGLTPEGQSTGAAPLLSQYTASFNNALAATYLSLGLPGAHLTLFDTWAAQNQLVANAASLGFTHGAGQSCFTGYVNVAGVQCGLANESSYIFWDKVHPTTRTDQILGQQMAALVPEPASVLLMAMGVVSVLGWSLRSRR